MLNKIKDRISLLLVITFSTLLFVVAVLLNLTDFIYRGQDLPRCEDAVGFGHTNAVIYDRFKMEVRLECSGPEEGAE